MLSSELLKLYFIAVELYKIIYFLLVCLFVGTLKVWEAGERKVCKLLAFLPCFLRLGILLPLHSRAQILGEVTHTQGHDVSLHIVLQTGLIIHC